MRLFSNPKHKKGFTLIEVIIIAVLVAVLAAVAIPTYLNYVNAQRQQLVDDLAKTGAAAANSVYRRTGTTPTVADLNLFLPNSTQFKVQVNSTTVTVIDSVHSKTGTANY